MERAVKLWKFFLAMVKRFFLLPFAAVKFRGKHVWLVCERGTDARDNGYHMFRYLRREHPEIEAWYVITKDSVDVSKIAALGNIAYFGSIRHWLAYLRAEKILTAFEPHFCPSDSFSFYKYVKKKNRQKIIFLQHGIMGVDVKIYHQEQSGFDMFICGAKPEFDYVLNHFNYTHGEVRYTGLARFDALHNLAVKHQILIMPTYRKWLQKQTEEEVAKSEYVKRWNHLLQSPLLTEITKKYNVQVIFYPHQLMQKYIRLFSSSNKNIIIGECRKFDVQPLLKESSMLITDYSSVHFDFAYMRKPVLYYQFDEEDFFSKHNARSYWNYDTMGFGEKENKEEVLFNHISEYLSKDFQMKPMYEQRIADFFQLYDTRNCERIYQEIITSFT